ncbi:MAG: hypothetical protein IJP46_01740, partial [Prevotella sp.]|nr:hypothetical protein [Prevotella sp.]
QKSFVHTIFNLKLVNKNVICSLFSHNFLTVSLMRSYGKEGLKALRIVVAIRIDMPVRDKKVA